jgi:hypothetical protein
MVPTTNTIAGINLPNSNDPTKIIFWNGGQAALNSPWRMNNGPQINLPVNGGQTGFGKSITIQNNSSQTIYPFLRDGNDGSSPYTMNRNPANPGNYYDPFDLVGNAGEYREYVGYKDTDGTWRLGLPVGATITVYVPLVFWDSGRLYLATDGANLITTAFAGVSNPFKYNPAASLGVSLQSDANSWVKNDSAGNGLVMFYSTSPANVAANDAPAQLSEYTIRDPYMAKWMSDPSQTQVIFNYNISGVDTMTAPMTMEAYQVPINNVNTQPDPIKNFGWIGSQLTYGPATTQGTMLYDMSAFTNPNNNTLLGQYFGGKGWPSYYNPNQNDIRIPSGYDLFSDSPLNGGTTSSYLRVVNGNLAGDFYLLTSGGKEPVKQFATTSVGANLNQTQFTLTLNFPTEFFNDLKQMVGAGVVDALMSSPNQQTPLVVGTVDPNSLDPTSNKISLVLNGGSLPPVFQNSTVSLTLQRRATDYAATDIMNLWYSWGQYYYNLGQNFNPPTQPVGGSINANSNVLTLNSLNNLKVGMVVTGDGIPTNAGPVTILGFNRMPGSNQVYLSQLASTTITSGSYQFAKPLALPFANSDGIKSITVTNPGSGYTPNSRVNLNITGGGGSGATAVAIVGSDGTIKNVVVTNGGRGYGPPNSQFMVTIPGGTATAMATVGTYYTQVAAFSTLTQGNGPNLEAFASSVYEVLTLESTIPGYTVKFPSLPAPMSLVATTIGTDAKNLPNSLYPAGELVDTLAGTFTNLVISVLRGVPDYIDPEYSQPSQWYPDPSTQNVAGPTPFNIYNLNPYVWFVHKPPSPQSPYTLGMTTYAFAVDDGISNANAIAPGGQNTQFSTPNNLEVVFSGSGNLSYLPNYNTNQFYPSLPWGTVSDMGSISTIQPGNPGAGSNSITLSNPIVYNQIVPPSPGKIGAYVSDSQHKLPAGARVEGTTGSLSFILTTSVPGLTATGDTFTFTGTAQSPPPPPITSPPPSPPPASNNQGSGGFENFSSPLQEVITLAEDEFLLFASQIVSLFELALGVGPDPALLASIAAYQNAISANPLDQTPLGQALILNLFRGPATH